MNFKNVTVAGSGVLGYQIAFQTAFSGFNVTVYDINDEILDKAKSKFDGLADTYKEGLKATEKQINATKENLHYSSDLAEAVKDADIVIEAVPEVSKIKTDFYKQLAKVAPEKTIFATNSSTFLPSEFAEVTGRPEKFLALHFANNIWKQNTAEIMGHAGTDAKVFDEVVDFATAIGMLPLKVLKEQPGYILNSLLIPFLQAASALLINGVADAKTIDKTWMKATKAPFGPFTIIDRVGMNTMVNITQDQAERNNSPIFKKITNYYKENFLDKGKLGLASGEGIYKYPNPEWEDKDFLTKA